MPLKVLNATSALPTPGEFNKSIDFDISVDPVHEGIRCKEADCSYSTVSMEQHERARTAALPVRTNTKNPTRAE